MYIGKLKRPAPKPVKACRRLWSAFDASCESPLLVGGEAILIAAEVQAVSTEDLAKRKKEATTHVMNDGEQRQAIHLRISLHPTSCRLTLGS